ncbi:MAG: AAA family ATPase [Nitrososphaerota archaeon]
MITSVELSNFISHNMTHLVFENGVTVFVGHNGAGKSSVIDAITFGLFGEHTRKSNKSLIRRGTSRAYVKVNFTSKGKSYEAIRAIDSKGTLSAQLFEKKGGELAQLAAGERKQYGESTSEKIESTIGLDFAKLKIASIVQQGELNSIIRAKPKEFKELLNAIIGIDKLDLASESLKLVQKNFRQTIQQRLGYDDTHADLLARELEQKRLEIEKSEPQKQALQKRKEASEAELQKIEQEIKSGSQKEAILKQLEERKADLTRYVKEAIASIQKEISEKERRVRECEGCFDDAIVQSDLEAKIRNAELGISDIDVKMRDFEKQQTILQEHQALARKLQLQDGKCPVCDSRVDNLRPIFQMKHIQSEQETIRRSCDMLEEKRRQTLAEKVELTKKHQRSIIAKTTLAAHSIQKKEQLDMLRSEIGLQKNLIERIPPAIATSGHLVEAAAIDSHARLLYEKIEDLKNQIGTFDPAAFSALRQEFEHKRRGMSKTDQEFGAIIEKIKQASQRMEKITSILDDLKDVKNYLEQLEQIQNNVYNRDGKVATSLRSWAMSAISSKASEYLEMLNTKVHRVVLSEKTRDVTITCYSKDTPVDIDSLSGGEQVSAALALRLGMAHLLGASNLNFVILDEPTTHLDSERRRSLVQVLSQLSNISNDATGPLQLIIITHDTEIFEDSSVEKIFKFESSQEGTKVSLL